MSIKEYVAGPVKFKRYHKGNLWYVTENGFEFPVPVEDTGDAEFLSMDKGMLYMRWIRKHLDVVEKAKQEQELTIS